MRCLLYEAATVMMNRSSLWSRPKSWAIRIQRKAGAKKATVALGRKLAVTMHRMLITRKPFEFGEPKEAKKKIKKEAA